MKESFVLNRCPYSNFLETQITQSNKNVHITFGIDERKINTAEVVGHFLTADINKIKKDKIILGGDSSQNE